MVGDFIKGTEIIRAFLEVWELFPGNAMSQRILTSAKNEVFPFAVFPDQQGQRRKSRVFAPCRSSESR